MVEAGLGSLLEDVLGPRKRCEAISKAGDLRDSLLDEVGQRSMIEAIRGSYQSYCSGLKCYAAFCDALGVCPQFPASERTAIRFVTLFRNASTAQQYLKHLKWAHRFLRLDCGAWNTDSLKQVIRGISKSGSGAKTKPAATSRQVRDMVKEAVAADDLPVAALMAVARHFMLRVPSEGVGLQWSGDHSKVTLEENRCTIFLAKRKNCPNGSTLSRNCVCDTTGSSLCSVHWLHRMKALRGDSVDVFGVTKHKFARRVKEIAADVGIPEASRFGTHAFRRGMAQDILDYGGSLASLLRAGDWSSSAYLKYLRSSQPQDAAVAHAVLMLTDSEDES